MANGTIKKPPKEPDMDFDVLRLTGQSFTSGTPKVLKTYDRKVYGVMRGYVAGSADYDRDGQFGVENGNKVYYSPKKTQTSVTIECVVALEKS